MRVVEKLINGVNTTHDGKNMWLAPFSRYTFNQKSIVRDSVNEIRISFDVPICVSLMRFWNYSKTPLRGVNEFEVLCDDAVIYRVSIYYK